MILKDFVKVLKECKELKQQYEQFI